MKAAIKPLLLSEVKPGKRVLIVGFVHDNVPLKMLEMGLLPGNEVFVKRLAPMQDPIHLEVAGYDLALRHDEAMLIEVQEIESTEAQVS